MYYYIPESSVDLYRGLAAPAARTEGKTVEKRALSLEERALIEDRTTSDFEALVECPEVASRIRNIKSVGEMKIEFEEDHSWATSDKAYVYSSTVIRDLFMATFHYTLLDEDEGVRLRAYSKFLVTTWDKQVIAGDIEFANKRSQVTEVDN